MTSPKVEILALPVVAENSNEVADGEKDGSEDGEEEDD